MSQAAANSLSGTSPSLTLEEARERFSKGGLWRPKQVARILGWSRSLVYWHIQRGTLEAERYSPRSLRVRGEAVIELLDSLQQP